MDRQWLADLKRAALGSGVSPKVDRFYFLRHGETAFNRENIVQGWIDTPLNALGEAQALQSALALAGHPVTAIIHSPLQRARRTAELVAQQTGFPLLRGDERLKERHFGGYEGQPATSVAWTLHDEHSESYEEFAARTAQGLNDSLQEGVPLIVAHGGTRRIAVYGLGLDISGPAMGNAVPLEFVRIGGQWRLRVLYLPTITEAGIES